MSESYAPLLEQSLTLDELLSGTFNSILRIEEQSLDSRFSRGLSIADIHTLVAVGLYEHDPMNVVASRLNVTLATLTTAAKKLERQGYVRRERCSDDRRKVLLSLTARGRKVYRAHRLFHEKMLAAALSGLSADEARVLATSLAKVKGFFDARL